MFTTTAYGTVSAGTDGAEVYGEFAQLYAWATRPGAAWPCSDLRALDSISVTFDSRGDLVDITGAYDGRPASSDQLDISCDELSAWTSDVLRAAGLADHPAVRGGASGADLVTCSKCGAETDSLATFPGGLCLSCYEKTPDATRPISGAELVAMWGGNAR